MSDLDRLDLLFICWAFFLQVVLILHFALRKRFFASYTQRYGWLVYALSIPSALVSLLLLAGGKSWSFWLGGFLFMVYAAFGYQVDYVKKIQWRKPLVPRIMFPYITLYLVTVMFYWWPLGILSRPLWLAYALLFVISTLLNITSH